MHLRGPIPKRQKLSRMFLFRYREVSVSSQTPVLLFTALLSMDTSTWKRLQRTCNSNLVSVYEKVIARNPIFFKKLLLSSNVNGQQAREKRRLFQRVAISNGKLDFWSCDWKFPHRSPHSFLAVVKHFLAGPFAEATLWLFFRIISHL